MTKCSFSWNENLLNFVFHGTLFDKPALQLFKMSLCKNLGEYVVTSRQKTQTDATIQSSHNTQDEFNISKWPNIG